MRLRRSIQFAAIAVAALLAYWPALRGSLLWDDDAHITAAALQSFHGLWRIWFALGATQQYYPLLHSAFWVEHRLWGDAVLGYHLANLAQHAFAACLVVLIVRRLALPGAWLAGFIFALHPVCVEAVAWISEQKSTLSAVFYLAAMLVYLRFDVTRRRIHYLTGFAFFVLALLTKTVTATLPAALLLLFWWKRGRLDLRRDVRPLIPWFSLAVAAGFFTAWVERTYIGAQGAQFLLGILTRIQLAGRVICFYAATLLWPRNLIFTYPHWTLDAETLWQWLYLTVVLIAALGLIWLARRTRGPLAAFLFFVGTLFPVLGFFNIFPFLYSYVADHFQYLASLGIIVPLAAITAPALDRLGRAAKATLPTLLLGTLAILTWRQAAIYRNAETLYRATLARNPQSWMAHNNLGVILLDQPGQLQAAISEFDESLRINPDNASAHNNLGNALARTGGMFPQAVAEFQAALRLDPTLVQAHKNMAAVLTRLPGGLPAALHEFQAALQVTPADPKLHNDLGVVLMQVPDRLPDAVAEFESALHLDPGFSSAHANLGSALARLPGRSADSIAEFEVALRQDPVNSQFHDSFGVALAQIPGRLPEAVTEFQTATRLNPDFPEAHNNLGRALSRLPGRLPDAVAEYQVALHLQPGYTQARINLRAALDDRHQ